MNVLRRGARLGVLRPFVSLGLSLWRFVVVRHGACPLLLALALLFPELFDLALAFSVGGTELSV